MLELIKIYILKWLMSGIEEEAECDCEYWDEEEDNQHPCMGISPISNELLENWTPPARYCVHTGGMEIWCDQVEPSLMSIDLYYTLKLGGVDRAVRASLSEQSYIIFDYEATPAPKAFNNTPKTSIDPITHVKQEETDQEDDIMDIERVRPISQDTGVASAYA